MVILLFFREIFSNFLVINSVKQQFYLHVFVKVLNLFTLEVTFVARLIAISIV